MHGSHAGFIQKEVLTLESCSTNAGFSSFILEEKPGQIATEQVANHELVCNFWFHRDIFGRDKKEGADFSEKALILRTSTQLCIW